MTISEDFRWTERFELRSCLGSGSFGRVYEAYDRERGTAVALKVPHAFKAADLLRLKQEFRSLADLSHPNLATLHELLSEGEQWFFSMELLEGKDFFSALRDGGEAHGDSHSTLHPDRGWEFPRRSEITYHPFPSGDSPGGFAESSEFRAKTYPCSPPKDFERIRRALRDLVEGLSALHQAGIVHRDLKPSNVIITPEGRLVILDFGLAAHHMGGQPDEGGVAGTPAFIAPEQLEGAGCSPASDWYSLGVMLYQVLTGQPPYVGTYLDIVRAKAWMDPCPPSLQVEGIPEDLEGLCMALMERDPLMRPSSREILERLEQASTPGEQRRTLYLPAREVPGRDLELGLLFREYQSIAEGEPRAVWLHGESGSGKSGLVQRFLKELRRREPSALILPGRCYEQETVPFKALDSLVDALSTSLKALPALSCKALFPRQMQALLRLFPVLGQVPGLEELPQLQAVPDALELRRRAFQAFRELLARLAKLHPLVLVIEDLQWGDMDSAALLEELFCPPDVPALMLLLTFRSDERSSSPILRKLCSSPADVFGTVTEIELRSLDLPEARALALAFLGGSGEGRELLAERVARESGGNPFFICELAYFFSQEREAMPTQGRGLGSYIQDRIRSLPEDARELLEVVSLAGCPVSWGLVREVMGRTGGGYHGFAQLRGLRMLRVRGAQDDKLLEAYHERVRKAVVEGVDAKQAARWHIGLGLAMEARGDAEPSLLASHFREGGAFERAAHHYERAGEQAELALAFDQAATFFGEAVALLASPFQMHRPLVRRYAEALCMAGRSAEAAEVFEGLLVGADGAETLFLQRRAAEEFLRSGHIDRGTAMLERLLPQVGARIPRTPTWALLSAMYRRILLKARGLSFTLKDKAAVTEDLLQRIDILWAGAMGFGPIDPIRGADFQCRQLLLSLKAGEPFRLVRALAHEAVFLALGGKRTVAETERVVAMTLSLAERMGHPNPMGRAFIGAGVAAIFQGRWKGGSELLDRAECLLKEHCTGLAYEIHIAQFQALVGYSVMGDLPELARRLPELLQEAKGRGDLLALTNLRSGYSYLLHLAQDDPDRARTDLHETMSLWSRTAFHAQHYNALLARVNIELYDGAHREALELLEGSWPRLKGSMLLRVQAIDITCRELRARAIFAAALEGGVSPRRLGQARADLHAIERENTRYGNALALRLWALQSLAMGRTVEAQGYLLQAELGFEACEMLLHATTARHARGRLQGANGRALVESAEAAMRERGIQNPGRFAGMHVPFSS